MEKGTSDREGTSCITGIGFWLPCGRTNFYNPQTDGVSGPPSSPVVSPVAGNAKLEDVICKRLRDVLATRNYSERTRVFSVKDSESRESCYPEGILFAHPGEPVVSVVPDIDGSQEPLLRIINWDENVKVDGLLLLATMFGFYYLLAKHNATVERESVISALKLHAASLIGGSFYSHYSGHDEGVQSTKVNVVKQPSLRQYEHANLGILNFFQMNSITEGLYNSHFDPSIFFRERSRPIDYESASQRYTLGQFSAMISVHFDLKANTVRQELVADKTITGNASYDEMRELFQWIHSDKARESLLCGFLDSTSSLCLRKPLKLMIERCRRALLSKMLDVTHRREPIVQAESPSGGADQILFENEDQLRGYIMFVSAKLPIIKNISNHLEEQSEEEQFDGGYDVAKLKRALRAWMRLFTSLIDNVHEVENAIKQSRLDRSLYEQAQMRAEQETAAELERVRNRFGLVTNGASKWELPNVVGQWLCIAIALMALVISYMTINGGGKRYIELIFAGTLIVMLVCLVIPFIIKWAKSRSDSNKYLVKPENDEYHYEFDFHLNVPLESKDAYDLSHGAFSEANRRRSAEQIQKPSVPERPHQRDTSGMRLAGVAFMHTYRVDRLSNEEATFKVHLEANVEDLSCSDSVARNNWFGLLFGTKRREPRYLIVSIIYELLAHLPSANHHCILRDVRVIALKNSQLSIRERTRLQHLIIHQCINVFISNRDDRIKTDPESAEHDPSLYLDRLYFDETKSATAAFNV